MACLYLTEQMIAFQDQSNGDTAPGRSMLRLPVSCVLCFFSFSPSLPLLSTGFGEGQKKKTLVHFSRVESVNPSSIPPCYIVLECVRWPRWQFQSIGVWLGKRVTFARIGFGSLSWDWAVWKKKTLLCLVHQKYTYMWAGQLRTWQNLVESSLELVPERPVLLKRMSYNSTHRSFQKKNGLWCNIPLAIYLFHDPSFNHRLPWLLFAAPLSITHVPLMPRCVCVTRTCIPSHHPPPSLPSTSRTYILIKNISFFNKIAVDTLATQLHPVGRRVLWLCTERCHCDDCADGRRV